MSSYESNVGRVGSSCESLHSYRHIHTPPDLYSSHNNLFFQCLSLEKSSTAAPAVHNNTQNTDLKGLCCRSVIVSFV